MSAPVQHTPFPWRVGDWELRDGSKPITADGTHPNSLHVAHCLEMMREGEREANQALIVRAVNAHEALVAALQEALPLILEDSDRPVVYRGTFSHTAAEAALAHDKRCDCMERIRAALKLAEGGAK